MKRRIQVFLLLVIALPTLLAILLINVSVHRSLMSRIDRQVAGTHQEMLTKFGDFDMLLAEDESELARHMAESLPKITGEILALRQPLKDIPRDRLAAIAKRYGVDYLYLIDRNTIVVNTNFAPDLNFELGTISSDLRQLLEGLLGTGKVVVDRMNVSSKTGSLQKYAYYAPPGRDYLVEVSVTIQEYLAREHSERYADYLFRRSFSEVGRNRLLLRSVEIFRVNDLGQFPILDPTERLPEDVVLELRRSPQVERRRQRTIEMYEQLKFEGTLFGSSEFMVLRTTFDLKPLVTFVQRTMLLGLAVLLVAGLASSLVASRFFDRFIIRRVEALNAALNRVGQGDYSQPTVVEGTDEVASIATRLNQMQTLISDREAAIEDARATLETKVAERTLELSDKNQRLEEALGEVQRLSGLLPICAGCKMIRDEQGAWQPIEQYLHERSGAQFSHSICPECMKELYPETYERLKQQGKVA